MPVLLFLIDTSASMNQRSHLGTSYLDIAKGAVETFLKLRSRDPASRGDRYMLVSFEEAPAGIKAGWKDSHATFMTELRNLQAAGLTSIGQSLRTAFDLLNLNRLVSGIDNYGQGRNPFFLEPAIIVAITDGSKLTSSSGVQDELHLPLTTPLPGSELTKEPFRWDQRLFSLVLRIPGHASPDPEPMGGVPLDPSPITPMCEVTGGRSYSVFSQRMLNQCLESLVQKIQSGVVINFEKTGPDPPPTEGLVSVLSAYLTVPLQPPRAAHPQVKFSCVDSEPMVVDKVPFDKYELEPSPLTQYILERKSPHTCWQVFVCNSAKYGELGQPFGYLKASTALNCVNLFVMPYNYPVVLPLLDDLITVHKFKPPAKWRQSFENYLKTVPPYYITALRKALRMMGAPNLLADNMEYGLSYTVVSYLKKLSQQAKIEADRVCASVGKKAALEGGIKLRCRSAALSLAHRKDFTQLLHSIMGDGPALPVEANTKEFAGFQLAALNKALKPQGLRNPYDIPRSHLLDQLSRMRRNLLHASICILKGQDQDQLHSVPIAQMGNYQDYLKHCPSPLREADPDQPKRLHTFGNPFKLDKKAMMVDEADEFVTGTQGKGKRPGESSSPVGGGAPKRRRCMSPLLRLGRAYTPPKTPPRTPDNDYTELGNHINHLESDSDKESSPAPESEPIQQRNHLQPDEVENQQDRVQENGQSSDSELSLGSEGEEETPRRYPSPCQLKKIRNQESQELNSELRVLITKEIRKPGRRYEKIFYLLKQIQGSLETRLIFLQSIIKEAARFKKRVLIEQLENFLEEIHLRANSMNHLDGF
ncbi:integrator complex subunit 6-like protein [Labeo rohita]|uniref:Integrator complex subunit 6-like protein n=1 Tax=Labeo rohita TaxID=84645 RepID=A0A498N4N4_LABRO|nr:integrator complex subunit 6-like protein [Labeo rohita]